MLNAHYRRTRSFAEMQRKGWDLIIVGGGPQQNSARDERTQLFRLLHRLRLLRLRGAGIFRQSAQISDDSGDLFVV
jgi:hypothetical protein